MEKIKVAVIGSCATRDNFNSQFVKNYKDYYKCVVSQHQMSLISLTSDPIPFIATNVSGDTTEFNKLHLISELEKSIIYHLTINEPDYVILDFYADLFFGIRELNNSYITDKVFKFEKINIFKDFEVGNAITLKKDFNNYLKLWKRSADIFVEHLKEELPNCKIVINKARFTNEFFDQKTKQIKNVTEELGHNLNLDLYNQWWEVLDQYFIENHGVRYIDYEDKHYLADPNHIWDLFYVHFTNEYYQDFTKKFLKIIIDDLIAEKKVTKNLNRIEELSTRVNLVKNSTFNVGKCFWTYWHNDFKIISEDNSTNKVSNIVTINKTGEKKDLNRQLWSNAIEVNADGDQTYTISFEVKIEDINKVDSQQAIFSIRLYDKPTGIFQNTSVQHYYIKKNQFNIRNKEWVKCTYTITPFTGKYLKVGPYLFRNGNISWRKIKVEKGDSATEWLPSYKEDI